MGKRILLAMTMTTMLSSAYGQGTWGGRALIENKGTIEKQTNGEHTAASTLYFYINNDINDKLRVTHLIAGEKQLSGLREQNIVAGYLATTYLTHNGSDLTLTLASRLYLPYNKEDRRNTGFQSRIYLNPILSFNLPQLKSFKVYYAPIVTRSFYKYKTNHKAEANPSYTATNRVIFEYLPNDRSSVALDVYNTHKWDQYNERGGDSFTINAEAEYQVIPETFFLALGYVNEGATFGPRGRETNFNFYNRDGASIYTNLDFRF